jgi:peptide deformylase
MATKRLGLVAPDDPILTQTAVAIPVEEISSAETQAIIEKLLSLAYGEQADRAKPVLVGLAAPQAGISKRIILVDSGADGHGGISNLQVFLNPEIVEQSKETAEWYEGCFSTDRVCGIVNRPTSVTVIAFDRNGDKIRQTYKDRKSVV